jgi:hypothetical protein
MARRQLAKRDGGGIVVQLVWDDSAPAGSDLFVEYRDEQQEVFYTVYPPRDRALEAFYHPNAYSGDAVNAPPDLDRGLAE